MATLEDRSIPKRNPATGERTIIREADVTEGVRTVETISVDRTRALANIKTVVATLPKSTLERLAELIVLFKRFDNEQPDVAER
jgi:hypothetical protein